MFPDAPIHPASSSTPNIQPSAPNVQPAAQTITMSADFLESLLTRAISAATATSSSGNQAATQPSIVTAVANSTTPPPFVAAPTTEPPLGTSLFDSFPQIEASAILEIMRHEFKPMDLFKLDPAAQDKNLERKATLDMEGGVMTATPRGGSLRDYPTFSSLLEPLLVYFNILTTYAASSGDMHATLTIAKGCAIYTGHLSALNRQFQWNAVLQYHKSYFLARRREMTRGDYSGWQRSDLLLLTEHVYGHARTQNHSGSLSKSSRSAPNTAKQPVSSQICFSFNRGSCTSLPCHSGRIHKCQKCDSPDHGALSCSKST
jgi:hypothetical protein